MIRRASRASRGMAARDAASRSTASRGMASRASRGMASRASHRLTAMFLLLVAAFGCSNDARSKLHWFLDMHDSPALKSQAEDFTAVASPPGRGADIIESRGGAGSVVRVPPEGSVPQGYVPYLIDDIDTAGKKLKNPLRRTRSALARGQKRYNVFCSVCHGFTGMGDGPVIPRLPLVAASLRTGPSRDWPDGKMFHMITRGRAAMRPFAAEIAPDDRWAIVHYVRLLQVTAPKTAKERPGGKR